MRKSSDNLLSVPAIRYNFLTLHRISSAYPHNILINTFIGSFAERSKESDLHLLRTRTPAPSFS